MAGLLSGTILTLFIIPVIYQLAGGRDRKPETGTERGTEAAV
jgi:Cu/Ag efflux pump CusA